MVTGPTNAGKSTLADAIGRKLGIAPIHIDQFSHLPDTNWQPRDVSEFHAMHDTAILAEEWVMDGNYTAIMPQRYARATGIVVIDDISSTAMSAISGARCSSQTASAAWPEEGIASNGR
ncbi:MAG: hypothetical protein JWQ22_460 [Devosia sp.]|nr:hypothetical protein [Devosia sp.]